MDRAYIIAACIAVLILFALLWYRANVKTQETAVELVGTLHSKYKDNKAPAPTHRAAPAPQQPLPMACPAGQTLRYGLCYEPGSYVGSVPTFAT